MSFADTDKITKHPSYNLGRIPEIARERSSQYGTDAIISDISFLLGLKDIQRMILQNCEGIEVPIPMVISAGQEDRRRVSQITGFDLQPMFYEDEESAQIGKYSVENVAKVIIESKQPWIFKPNWGSYSQGVYLINSENGYITITINDGVFDHNNYVLHEYLLDKCKEIKRVPNKFIEFAVDTQSTQQELEKILDLGAVRLRGHFDPGLVEPLFKDEWQYENRPFETRHIVTPDGNVEHIFAEVGRPNILDNDSNKKYWKITPNKMYKRMAQELKVSEQDIISYVETTLRNTYKYFTARIKELGLNLSQVDEINELPFNIQFDLKYLPSKSEGGLPTLGLVEVHIIIGDERVEYEFAE